jgi:AcrR family transcriptional regulator
LFGYNGVGTREIASHEGVNKVTIYRRYPCKRDLNLAVLESELGKVHLRGDLFAAIAEAGEGRTALARTFELVAKILQHGPELLRIVQCGALEAGNDLDPLLRKYIGELVKVISSYLEPWGSRGQLRCAGDDALVFTCIAIVLNHLFLHRVFSCEGAGPENMFADYAESGVA